MLDIAGRTSPEEVCIAADTTNVGDILVYAGRGYITDGVQFTSVRWNDYTIEDAGDLAQGNWYVSLLM
jgi:hypothetical protein